MRRSSGTRASWSSMRNWYPGLTRAVKPTPIWNVHDVVLGAVSTTTARLTTTGAPVAGSVALVAKLPDTDNVPPLYVVIPTPARTYGLIAWCGDARRVTPPTNDTAEADAVVAAKSLQSCWFLFSGSLWYGAPT